MLRNLIGDWTVLCCPDVFQCSCVDGGHVAVAPAELTAESNEDCHESMMSSEIVSSCQSRPECLPITAHYNLLNFIGQGCGGLSKVFVGCHNPSRTLVVVKQTNVDIQSAEQLDELKYEVQILRSLCHPNILPFYCSFVTRQEVWNILPLMQYGSCADILKSSFPDGMSEILIAATLWEVLQGLEYLHKMGYIHRAIKGSHILVGTDGRVCLSGLRNSIALPQEFDTFRVAHHFPSHAVAVLPWMAPEILQQDLQGYNTKSDIYSVGITAIQLARGIVPYKGMPPTKVLLEKLKGSPPKLCDSLVPCDPEELSTEISKEIDSGFSSGVTTVTEGGREGSQINSPSKFSLAFHQMVDLCLQRDPFLRPTASALAAHLFFKQVKRKTKELLPELLSLVPSLANWKADKALDEDIESSIASDSFSAMTLDEWSF